MNKARIRAERKRRIRQKLSPRRLRAKYTHRTNFVYALCISLCEADAGHGNEFVNRCLCTYSQERRQELRKEDAYRKTFIYQTKQAVRCGRRIDYISNPKRQEYLYATYQTEGATSEFGKILQEKISWTLGLVDRQGNVSKGVSSS